MEFDTPPGKLNKVSSKIYKRSIEIGTPGDSDLTSLAMQAAEIMHEKENSVLEKTGQYKAIVLRVDREPNKVDQEGFLNFLEKRKTNDSAGFKFVRISAYIPIMHKGLYPLPRVGNTDDPRYPDHHIIDMYPTFTARNDDLIMDSVKVGDIVIVDYSEKNEYTGDPIFVTPIVTNEVQILAALGQNIQNKFNRPGCPPASVQTPGQSLQTSTSLAKHQGLVDLRARARQSNMKGFVFGDSQAHAMGPGMSKWLEENVGLNMIKATGRVSPWTKKNRGVIGKHSKSLATLTGIRNKSEGYWPVLKRYLKQVGDGVICIVGGRNSPTSESILSAALKKIISVAPNATILWVTPPGKVPAYQKLPYIVKKPIYPNPASGPPYNPIPLEKRTSHLKLRKRVEAAAAQFPNKVFHIDTYSLMPDYVKNGSKNKKGDGVHLTFSDLPELLSGLSSMTGLPINQKSGQRKPGVPNPGNDSTTPDKQGGLTVSSGNSVNCQPLGSMGQHGGPPVKPNTEGLVPGGKRAQSFPASLSQVDINRVMPGLYEKWGPSNPHGIVKAFQRGIKPGMDPWYSWCILCMAAAEVIERYWRTWDSSAKLIITDHWRGKRGGDNGNHKGPAMDFEIRYKNKAIPSVYQWCSVRYLMGEGRIPRGGLGLYMNFNGLVKERNLLHPPGLSGPALNEQGKNTARSCKAPGGSTNVHYDYRGFADFKKGKGRGVGTPGGLIGGFWWRGSSTGSSRDDIRSTQATKNYLKSTAKGQQILDLLNSWKTGNYGNNPPGFNFVRMSEFVPSWSQVLGLEPWVGNQRATS
tara:strand:+ start:772 stop:3183 length:2412 start_codon:yes stop_codon:yes gene_type:complete